MSGQSQEVLTSISSAYNTKFILILLEAIKRSPLPRVQAGGCFFFHGSHALDWSPLIRARNNSGLSGSRKILKIKIESSHQVRLPKPNQNRFTLPPLATHKTSVGLFLLSLPSFSLSTFSRIPSEPLLLFCNHGF